MDLQTAESVLLVVEGSAAIPAWPSHLGAPPEAGWSVLEQEEWESAGTFLGRVNQTLEPGALMSGAAQVVVLVAGSWMDEGTLRARDHLANEILGQLARAGGGTLLLSYGALQDAALRGQLTELAADLAAEWDDSRLVVRTRFARPSRLPEPRRASDLSRGHSLEQLAAAAR